MVFMTEEKKKIEVEVIIDDSYTYPDVFTQKTMSVVVMLDNHGNEFVWRTTSKNYPEIGETKTLIAKIAEIDIEKRNWNRTAYRVTNCRFK